MLEDSGATYITKKLERTHTEKIVMLFEFLLFHLYVWATNKCNILLQVTGKTGIGMR